MSPTRDACTTRIRLCRKLWYSRDSAPSFLRRRVQIHPRVHPMACLTASLFGPLEVKMDDQPATNLATGKARANLRNALSALQPGKGAASS
jgi:hypothetical protein